MSLTTALVSHAYRDDYDVAFLVCGDGDYVPVVEEIKNAGKRVVVAFFGPNYGLSTDLRIAADRFVNIEGYFRDSWEGLHRSIRAKADLAAREAQRVAAKAKKT